MLGTYIHMYMYLWCICNLIEPILRHRKWLNNHIIQGPDNVLVYVSSRGHESCLSHAFWSSPMLNASVKTSLSKSKPFTAFFFVALAIQGFSFAHFFRQTGVRWFCPLWGSYSIERVAFLEPHDFVPEVCMEYPQYTYYI